MYYSYVVYYSLFIISLLLLPLFGCFFSSSSCYMLQVLQNIFHLLFVTTYKYYIKSIESDFGRKNISCYMAPSSLCFSVTLPQYFFVCSISIIHKNQATRVMTGSINNKKIIDGFHRIDCLFYSCFSFCHLSFQNFHRSRIY